MITICLDDEVIIQGVQMLLDVDLLQNYHASNKPECKLIAATENNNIERISYDNMVKGDVKLYHILSGGLANEAIF